MCVGQGPIKVMGSASIIGPPGCAHEGPHKIPDVRLYRISFCKCFRICIFPFLIGGDVDDLLLRTDIEEAFRF